MRNQDGKGKEKTYAEHVGTFKMDYDQTHSRRDTAKYYGTHDWIAERALYLAYNKYPENKFLSMLYLDVSQLKMYYLLGTEAPDAVKDLYSAGKPILNTGLNIITKNDFQTCLGRHILRFQEADGDINTVVTWNLATYAETCQNKVYTYLEQGDCRAAAFFLGAIAHYIGDACCYPHLMDGLNHANWEHWVNTLTTRKIVDEYYSDGQITTDEPFYQWRGNGLAEGEFNRLTPTYDAKTATWYTGHACYFGRTVDSLNIQPFYYDAEIDHNFYETHPTFPGQHFSLTDPERRGSYWEDLVGEPDCDFLTGVHDHLNIAVFYMASILNHIKDSYVKCAGGLEDELTQVVYDMAIESLFLWIFVATGNVATLLALLGTLNDKQEALAPLQQ
jgi:hypothetical protein